MAVRDGPPVNYRLLQDAEFEKFLNDETYETIASGDEFLSEKYNIRMEEGTYIHVIENDFIPTADVYLSLKKIV